MPNNIENLRNKLKETKAALENAKSRNAPEKRQKKMKGEIEKLEAELAKLENSTGNNATSEEKTQPKDGDDNQQGNDANNSSEPNTENGEPDNSEPIQPYRIDFANNNDQNNQERQGEGEVQENTQQTIDNVTTEENRENPSSANNTSQENIQPENSGGDDSQEANEEEVGEARSNDDTTENRGETKREVEEEKTDNETSETPVVIETEEDKGQEAEEETTNENETQEGRKSELLSPSNFKKRRRVSWGGEEQTILIVGSSGSGKSTLGNVLTEKKTFKQRPSESSPRETKEVRKENFSITNEEENLTKPYQVIDTPDFFEGNDSQKKELLKKTLEILCQELNKLNQIFLVVNNEDIDNKNKVEKVLKYSQWVVSLFSENELKKHFSIVVTKFSEFANENACEERKQQLSSKLSLESEISSNIIFVDLVPPQKTSEDSGEDNKEENSEIISQSRGKLIEHLKTRPNSYQIDNNDNNFKKNFEKLLLTPNKKKKKTKRERKNEETAPKFKGIDIKTTLWVLVVIVIIYLVIYIVDQWKEINDFNSQDLIEEEEE